MPDNYEWEPVIAPRFEDREQAMQYAVDHAQRAHSLLSDPSFNELYKELLDEQVLMIVQSKPGQVELREDCYFRIRGLQDLVHKMNGWINRFETMKADAERGQVNP